MSDSGGIPEIQCNNPDGRPRTRLEMDQWLRKEIPKVHWLRIHACRTLNLPKQISWDMKEIVLRHWILDELVRRQRIIGDLLGVNATASNDEGELRQFEQRLTALIQAGQAVQPHNAEGINMNGYTPPPPPMGGAPQPPAGGPPAPAYQPGPPAAPPGPPGVPMSPPGYQAGPPGPPQPPQQPYQPPGPPGPPGGGYAQPPAGVPMAPPAGPPAPARRGRPPRAESAQGAPPPAAPVPPMAPPPPGVPQAPQGFAPVGFQPQGAPQGFAPPAPSGYQTASAQMPPAPAAAPAVDLSGVLTKLDQVINIEQSTAARFAALEKKIEVLSMVNTTLCRAIYQMGGNADAETFLRELQEVAAKAAATPR